MKTLLTMFAIAFASAPAGMTVAHAGDVKEIILSHETKTPYLPKGYVSDFYQYWFSKHLSAMGEPVLAPEGKDKDYFVFRMLYLPCFAEPVAVRFEKTGTKIIRKSIQLSGMGGYEPGDIKEEKLLEITDSEFARISEEIKRCSFETMTGDDGVFGYDGSLLVVECIKDGKYTLIVRWTPESETKKRGLCSVLALVSRLFQEAGFWKAAECPVAQNGAIVPAKDMPPKLRVEKMEFTIPQEHSAAKNALSERFLTSQADWFSTTVTSDSWDRTWREWAAFLVEKATNANLNALSLSQCLDRLRQNGENAGECVVTLPVAAYLARRSNGECWIIVCLWGSLKSDDAKSWLLNHIGVWAMDRKTADYVSWATCK